MFSPQFQKLQFSQLPPLNRWSWEPKWTPLHPNATCFPPKNKALSFGPFFFGKNQWKVTTVPDHKGPRQRILGRGNCAVGHHQLMGLLSRPDHRNSSHQLCTSPQQEHYTSQKGEGVRCRSTNLRHGKMATKGPGPRKNVTNGCEVTCYNYHYKLPKING